jgi:3'-phosphoadenosine 5'-phosphosulfate sulfotransferase (PAPS reductase)/FAD synthetase
LKRIIKACAIKLFLEHSDSWRALRARHSWLAGRRQYESSDRRRISVQSSRSIQTIVNIAAKY